MEMPLEILEDVLLIVFEPIIFKIHSVLFKNTRKIKAKNSK